MQRALFIPNSYYLISIIKGTENDAEKYSICLHRFVCLKWNAYSHGIVQFHIGFSQLEDNFLSVKEISYFNNTWHFSTDCLLKSYFVPKLPRLFT